MKKIFTFILLSVVAIFAVQIIAPTNNNPESVTSIENSYPEDQKFMNDLIVQTLNEIKNLNDAAKKKTWIDKSNELCSSSLFNAYDIKKDWIGTLHLLEMNDAGTHLNIKIGINNSNAVNQYAADANMISESLLFSLKKSDTIKFSGFFEEGKKSQNQCLNNANMFDENNPLLYKQEFKFKFKKIEKLPERLYYTKERIGQSSPLPLFIIIIIGVIIFRKNLKRIFWFWKK